jgi:hypothetical protein
MKKTLLLSIICFTFSLSQAQETTFWDRLYPYYLDFQVLRSTKELGYINPDRFYNEPTYQSIGSNLEYLGNYKSVFNDYPTYLMEELRFKVNVGYKIKDSNKGRKRTIQFGIVFTPFQHYDRRYTINHEVYGITSRFDTLTIQNQTFYRDTGYIRIKHRNENQNVSRLNLNAVLLQHYELNKFFEFETGFQVNITNGYYSSFSGLLDIDRAIVYQNPSGQIASLTVQDSLSKLSFNDSYAPSRSINYTNYNLSVPLGIALNSNQLFGGNFAQLYFRVNPTVKVTTTNLGFFFNVPYIYGSFGARVFL